ncbi:hypothetical protein CW748_12720 [Alteromonadales bacterium alter-6D02]|nr:hypothetical protein CW748_12720 [Alteromonadales bacterium alter-6D02]
MTGMYNVGYEQHFILIMSGFFTYLGLLIAEFILGPSRIKQADFQYFQSNDFKKLSGTLSLVFAPFFLIALIDVLGSGNVNKYELNTAGVFNALTYYFLAFLFIYITSSQKCIRVKMVSFILLFLFFYLVSGERDFFIRAFLLILFFLYITNQVSNKVTIISFVSGFILAPLSQSLKGVLGYNSEQSVQLIGFDNLIVSLFSGEFMSQGRNFYWMLEFKDRMLDVYGNMLVNDILRFFKLYEHSSASLFGEKIVGRTGGSGVGFSLLGEMYFTFWYFGLLFLGLSIGVLLKWTAKVASDSSLNIYLYITVLFSCSYALRADFANLLAGVIKVGLLPVVILILCRSSIRFIQKS